MVSQGSRRWEDASQDGERAALTLSSESKSRDTRRDKLEKLMEKLLDTFFTSKSLNLIFPRRFRSSLGDALTRPLLQPALIGMFFNLTHWKLRAIALFCIGKVSVLARFMGWTFQFIKTICYVYQSLVNMFISKPQVVGTIDRYSTTIALCHNFLSLVAITIIFFWILLVLVKQHWNSNLCCVQDQLSRNSEVLIFLARSQLIRSGIV